MGEEEILDDYDELREVQKFMQANDINKKDKVIKSSTATRKKVLPAEKTRNSAQKLQSKNLSEGSNVMPVKALKKMSSKNENRNSSKKVKDSFCNKSKSSTLSSQKDKLNKDRNTYKYNIDSDSEKNLIEKSETSKPAPHNTKKIIPVPKKYSTVKNTDEISKCENKSKQPSIISTEHEKSSYRNVHFHHCPLVQIILIHLHLLSREKLPKRDLLLN